MHVTTRMYGWSRTLQREKRRGEGAREDAKSEGPITSAGLWDFAAEKCTDGGESCPG